MGKVINLAAARRKRFQERPLVRIARAIAISLFLGMLVLLILQAAF